MPSFLCATCHSERSEESRLGCYVILNVVKGNEESRSLFRGILPRFAHLASPNSKLSRMIGC